VTKVAEKKVKPKEPAGKGAKSAKKAQTRISKGRKRVMAKKVR
jgi:hypothetical protein